MRFLGDSLKEKQKVSIALCSIFGFNLRSAEAFCSRFGVGKDCRVQSISAKKWAFFSKRIESELSDNSFLLLQTSLKRLYRKNIENLIIMQCYRGLRHSAKLPCRGQRTHTNASTVRR
uniref:Ribosomal protein S13 n=1 Tax=Goniomonas avonlea TaxID=1255295 RepID=A0A348G6L1_9CRYP|nr:ribosomal protein S13 [Goniomonas avonlea]